jgi:NAD(P)-dependent dehydrogenase (short-subunit alcohol dehydrogenase family)
MIYEDLKDKRVLVTGAGSGIGAATAVMFAQQGCFVGVHYFEAENGAKKTLELVKKYSDGCILKADVRDKKQVQKMVEDFAAKAGGADILINNGGMLMNQGRSKTISQEFMDDVIATNGKSVVFVTQAALPYMKKGKAPCIVNIGSIAGHHGSGPGADIYAAAKAPVITMTIAMAEEFAMYGIRVNSVLPGLAESSFHGLCSTPQRQAATAKETQLGRNGTAEDVAKIILFLASDAAGFITGECIGCGFHST